MTSHMDLWHAPVSDNGGSPLGLFVHTGKHVTSHTVHTKPNKCVVIKTMLVTRHAML